MNRNCNGNYYVLAKRRYYRCLFDGKVIDTRLAEWVDPAVCPNCRRKIEADDGHYLHVAAAEPAPGEVLSRTITTTEVMIHGRWLEHSREVVGGEPWKWVLCVPGAHDRTLAYTGRSEDDAREAAREVLGMGRLPNGARVVCASDGSNG